MGISAVGFAQEKTRDRIKTKVKLEKVAFITEKLDLSETEAQKFWPVYNAYKNEIDQLRTSLELNPHRDMTDKEAEDMMYAMLDGKSKEIDIQKKYIEKMKTAISARKIAMLFKVERQFKEKIVSKLKDKKREREMKEK
ncbi:MAG: hypothetical protein H7X99_02505 [Saprospiraceae bacterium]|nr:hypothetical protein [Saprospiraceae bacterium]